MDSYPLLGNVNERYSHKQLRDSSAMQTLFDKLVKQALRRSIPLTSIRGYENIITTVAKQKDINKRFGKGETLLHWAASYQSAYGPPTSDVLVLLLLGADPNIQDVLGRTPLHWAINHDSTDFAEGEILQYERKATPEIVSVVHQLLMFDASANITDTYGATPLCHAVWTKCSEVESILRPLTDESFPTDPEFILTTIESVKSIRCSKVDQWIQENTSDVNVNTERLQNILFCPGMGFLQHLDEVEMQKDQVLNFFRKISSNIQKEDPLLEFIPRLAGSMAEGTKCKKPDEQDIILQLLKFESICIPEESEFSPHGTITLKFTGSDDEMHDYEKYLLDGYLNREEILYNLMKNLEKQVLSTSLWSGEDVMNVYPSHNMNAELQEAIQIGDIGSLTFVWHSKYYKQIRLSIDVVPAIFIKDWQPDYAIIKDPLGRDVPNEIVLILRSFTEHVDYDFDIHGEYCKSETLKNDTFTLESLNGEHWDSESDCMSDNGNDEKGDDFVKRSDFYNTFTMRWMRNETGYSIPKVKGFLKDYVAAMSDSPDVKSKEDTNERLKAAYEKDNQLDTEESVIIFTENATGLETKDLACKSKLGREHDYQSCSYNTAEPLQSLDREAIYSKYSTNDCQRNLNIRQENSWTTTDKKPMMPGNKRETAESNDSTSTFSASCEKYMDLGTEIHYDENTDSSNSITIAEDPISKLETKNGKEICFQINKLDKQNQHSGETVSCETAADKICFQGNAEPLRLAKAILDHSSRDDNDDDDDDTIKKTMLIMGDNEDDICLLCLINDDNSEQDYEEHESSLEDTSEEPREDIGFRISYSKWETEAMVSFPHYIKSAYILSKTLVSFLPGIRAPLNRGHHKNLKGYSSINDIFTYLLKMALFSAVKKNQNHDLLKTASDIQTSNSDYDVVCAENTVSHFEQVVYSEKSSVPSTIHDCKIWPDHMQIHELKQITFWVDKLFLEIEESAKLGRLSSYFDPELNVLERITFEGKKKRNPYPSLLFLRKHCQMVRALIRL